MILRKPFYPNFTAPAIQFRTLMRLHKNLGRADGRRFQSVMREQVQQSRQVASEHGDCDPMGAAVLKTLIHNLEARHDWLITKESV